jgi:hypothetical protein
MQHKNIDIEKLNRKEIFTTDEYYFEEFPKHIINRIRSKNERVYVKTEFAWITVAALVLLMFGIFDYTNTPTPNELTETEIVSYITDNADLFQDEDLYFNTIETDVLTEQEQYLINEIGSLEFEEIIN